MTERTDQSWRWSREEILGEYGWGIAHVWLEDPSQCHPHVLKFRVTSQMVHVAITATLTREEALRAADHIERCANESVGVIGMALEDSEDGFLSTHLDATLQDGCVFITFRGQYGITGTVPCFLGDVPVLVSMLRDGALRLIEDVD